MAHDDAIRNIIAKNDLKSKQYFSTMWRPQFFTDFGEQAFWLEDFLAKPTYRQAFELLERDLNELGVPRKDLCDTYRHAAGVGLKGAARVRDRSDHKTQQRVAHAITGRFMERYFEPDTGYTDLRWYEPDSRGRPGEEFARTYGLRSDRDRYALHLKRYISCVPAKYKIRLGMTKDWLHPASSLKLLALDHAYIQFNTEMVGMIRVELDGITLDPKTLVAEIRRCLPQECWPALVVTAVPNPGAHLYWFLDAPVCWTKNGRIAPKGLYRKVHRMLVHALLDVGADPGCLTNPFHGKNPCHEGYEVFSPEDGEPRDINLATAASLLDEWNIDIENLRRRYVDTLHDGDVRESNALFNAVSKFARDNVDRFRRDDRKYEDFFAAVSTFAAEQVEGRHTRAANAVARNVAKWTWTHLKSNRRRGAARHELTEDMSQSECQAVGGRWTARQRRDKSVDTIVAAMRGLDTEGTAITKAAVRRVVEGVGKSTVYARFDEALEAKRAADSAAQDRSSETVLDKKLSETNGTVRTETANGLSEESSLTEGREPVDDRDVLLAASESRIQDAVLHQAVSGDLTKMEVLDTMDALFMVHNERVRLTHLVSGLRPPCTLGPHPERTLIGFPGRRKQEKTEGPLSKPRQQSGNVLLRAVDDGDEKLQEQVIGATPMDKVLHGDPEHAADIPFDDVPPISKPSRRPHVSAAPAAGPIPDAEWELLQDIPF